MFSKASTYIGTKLIQALRMNRKAYNDYRGWTVPPDENPNDEGYLVEYLDGHAGNDPRHVGYISWSPAAAFEGAYNSIHSGMSFGHALVALQTERRVRRAGWNGKGMYLILVGGSTGSYDVDYIIRDDSMAQPVGPNPKLAPFIAMRTVGGEFVPWLASQTDMLATDWMVVNDESDTTAEDLGYDAELRDVLVTTPIDPLNQDIYLAGNIYNDSRQRFADGSWITTSKLKAWDNTTQIGTTMSGTRYKVSIAAPSI